MKKHLLSLVAPSRLPLGQMSVHGMHILMRFSSTSILLLGHARTQELWSTTKLSGSEERADNYNMECLFYLKN